MNSRGAVLLVAVLCLALGWVTGQVFRSEPAPPPTYLEQLTVDLGLDAEQIQRINAILSEEDRQLEALIGEHRDELAQSVAERREGTETAILAELDADQTKRYLALSEP
jgi:hypothetical protein